MFHLLRKKEGNQEAHLEECQRKRDWAGLAKAYYHMGVAAMEEGHLNHAQVWLCRADTIYSADDAVYKKVGEKLTEDCSERIGQLEEEPMLYQDVPDRVSGMAENLEDVRARVWGLLSLARLVKLGERLAVLPGCEALGKLGWAVDMVLKSFQEPLTEQEWNGLRDLCSAMYELGDSPDFWGTGGEIEVPGQAPFQIFDLNGLMGAHLEIDAYVDGHLKMLNAVSQGEDAPAPETGIIVQPLLPDYYVRTKGGRLEEVPQIKAELERLWSDYEFVCTNLSWELIGARVASYKALDVLA